MSRSRVPRSFVIYLNHQASRSRVETTTAAFAHSNLGRFDLIVPIYTMADIGAD